MAKALGIARAMKTIVYLGAYGTSIEIQKPLQIYSNARFIPRLQRPCPAVNKAKRDLCYTKDVFGCHTGHKSLRDTQVYPPEFGQKVIKYYKEALLEILKEVDTELQAMEVASPLAHRTTCQFISLICLGMILFFGLMGFQPRMLQMRTAVTVGLNI